MNDRQGRTPQWPQYQSGDISSQQYTQHPQYGTPHAQNYISPQQPQWPPQHYPHHPQYNHPQLSQYPPQYTPQWQQQPSQPQLMQPIPPQMTNKMHTKKKIVFITASAIVLTITFVLGIAVGANLKGSSNPGLSSSTNDPSNNTSTSSTILTISGTNPAKVGDTISVGSVGCTLVSVNPNPLPGDAFSMPKAGDEFIVVNVRLTNNRMNDIDYYSTNFYARSSFGNTISSAFEAPSSYTSNNLLDTNGTIAPGNSVKGDVILQIPIGDHKAELLWEPYWGNNSTDNVWSLGL